MHTFIYYLSLKSLEARVENVTYITLSGYVAQYFYTH